MKKNNSKKIIKVLKQVFPNMSDKEALKYLNTQRVEYFYLTPLEFSQIDEVCLKTVIQNIKEYKYTEIMGS